jgi:hypothetical protein
MSFDSYHESIEVYKDYTYIMYILCDKTASFYSKIKNIINIPIVLCSTALSILNTTEFINNTDMIPITRNISIACNLLIAISVAILNLYKITEKEFAFRSHSESFLQLHNKINAEIAKSKTIHTKIDILRIINEYNLYSEQLAFHVPTRIRKYIVKNYGNYKLPLSLTNNNKKLQHFSKMAMFYNILKKQHKRPKSHTVTTNTSYTTTSNDESVQFSRSSSLSSINIQDDVYYVAKTFHNPLSPIQSHNVSPFSVFDELRNSPVKQLRMPAILPRTYMTNTAFSQTYNHSIENTSNLTKKLKRSASS